MLPVPERCTCFVYIGINLCFLEDILLNASLKPIILLPRFNFLLLLSDSKLFTLICISENCLKVRI